MLLITRTIRTVVCASVSLPSRQAPAAQEDETGLTGSPLCTRLHSPWRQGARIAKPVLGEAPAPPIGGHCPQVATQLLLHFISSATGATIQVLQGDM